MVPTAGRPSECWWPVLTPSTPLMSIGSSSALLAADAANELTNPERASAQAAVKAGADGHATADSSLVRTEAAPVIEQGGCDEASPLSLADLFSMVRDMGGKIVRSDDGSFQIDRMTEGTIAPQLKNALAVHRADLESFFPNASQSPVANCGANAEASNSPGENAEVSAAADAQFRCLRCREAVVGASDEFCDPCFLAELQSVAPEHE
jgi:hypothetical protein